MRAQNAIARFDWDDDNINGGPKQLKQKRFKIIYKGCFLGIEDHIDHISASTTSRTIEDL